MSRNAKEKDQYKPSISSRQYSLMSFEDIRAGKKSVWDELEITGGVTNISPGIWELNWLTSLYLNKNKLSRIPTDISRLQNLVRLDISSNNLKEIPAALGDITPLRELNLSHNHIKSLPCELGKLFNLQALELTGNPLPVDILNLHSQNNGTQKLTGYLLNLLAVTPVLPAERQWISIKEKTTRPACVFTVLCYNVLCDKYASPTMYGYCPLWALEWNYRRKGISSEIMRYLSDIITLQELETDQFYTWFLPELRKQGYDGIFSPKSRAKHMNENERKYVDGCAIFWKTEKFTLVKEHLIEFNQLAMSNHDGSIDMLNRVMPKDNIGLAALLHTTEQAWGDKLPEKHQIRQSILVCTAHIHWDPEFCDVKLIQTIMLMSEIRVIVNHILEDASRSRHQAKRDLSDVHLLLCGDLNSLPESGVVEFLAKGCVSMDHSDFKGHEYKTSLQKLALSKSHLSGVANQTTNMYNHSFSLASAYDYNIMSYTNYTYDFKGIIDYIFHGCHTMRTIGVLGPIDPQWFKNNKVVGCPHPNIPSDHFPLIAALELTPSHGSHQNGLLNR